ncbi:MAG TPA: isochorismatase family protein [Steroidobacteraceae bacterium]|jgi:nicotinamidase-related amidase/catechol 2,3-dioxygenase-like lactoylglutathione lyase family enzyme
MNLELLDLRKTALLVVDMQNAFCHKEGTLGISGVDTDHLSSVVTPLRNLIRRCQAVNMPVLWTVQEHFPIDHRRGRKRLPTHTSRRKRTSALVGTWDAELIDELKEFSNNPTFVIRKHRYGAFHETRLHIVLEMLGVDALLVAGLTTNACVETTIREAYLRDYDVVGVTDCIAGVNPLWESAAVEVWHQYFAETCSSAEVNAWIDKELAPGTLAVHHLLLKARDFERSKRFYLDLLGFSERRDAKPLPDGRPLISTRQGLGITLGGSGDQGQVDHFAFVVRNVEALGRRLKEAEVVFERELGPGPYGLAIYVRDPDGNILELFEVASKGA